MLIRVACPHCCKRFRVEDRFAGKKTTCTNCRQSFTVVAATQDDAAPSNDPAVEFEAWVESASQSTEPVPHADLPWSPPSLPQSLPAKVETTTETGKKKCPFCAEWIADGAIKCRFCNSMLVPVEGMSRPRERDPRLIYPSNSPSSPLLMAILSGCCIAGLGQMVLGQVTKGVIFLIGAVALAALTVGVSIFITWPLMGIDAYLVARKLKSGRPISEWECFPG